MMVGMRKLIAAAAVLPLVLAACGGDPKPKAAPSPVPTVWSDAEAGKQYLAIIGPTNESADRYSAAARAVGAKVKKSGAKDSGWENLPPLCAAQAKAEDAAARALAAGKWPAHVQAAIDGVVSEFAADRTTWLNCAKAKTLDEISSAFAGMPASTGAGQKVRVQLGLPGTG